MCIIEGFRCSVIFSVFLLEALAGVAQAEETLRHFEVYEIPDAGLIIYKPDSPAWDMIVDERRSNDAVILSTPNNYYPSTSVEIRLDQRFTSTPVDLPSIVETLNKTLREKTGGSTGPSVDFSSISYGNISGLQNQFNIKLDNEPYTIRHVVGLMPTGHIVTLMATTPSGMIDAIEPMLKKIYSNLKEIPKH